MQQTKKNIVLVTTKQPSSNPRLVKEAEALAENGYDVSVVYNYWSHWAEEADQYIFSSMPLINWIKVGSNPISSKYRYWYTRVRFKLFKTFAGVFENNSWGQINAATQFYAELRRKAGGIKADLYIAHNIGALPVAAAAAKKNKSLYAFDAEDFHRSQDDENTQEGNRAKFIEDIFFPGAAYITAASSLIAAEYNRHYPVINFPVINNVFSRKIQPVLKAINIHPLRLFWFSQTVGLKRGLQDVINAINAVKDFTIHFSVLGDASPEVIAQLQSLILNTKHAIQFMPPCNEVELIQFAATHHIGLALEPGFSLNNNIALSNKLFTYLLVGNAVVMSTTPAQQLFYNEYPDLGWCYQSGSIEQLIAILQLAGTDEALLNRKRNAAWRAANTKLNWETEQQHFLQLVKAIA